MALLEIIYGEPRRAKIGVVTLDASLREVHSKRNEMTDHPVEEGINISDHVRQRPDEVVIEGIITNTPVEFAASIASANPVDNRARTFERVGQGYDRLEQAMANKESLEIVTSFKNYSNMQLLGLDVVRDASTGNVMNAVMNLKQFRVATSEQLSEPEPEDPSNRQATDGGKKPTAPATEQQTATAEAKTSAINDLGITKTFREVTGIF